MAGLGGSCALVVGQRFKDSCSGHALPCSGTPGLSPATAMTPGLGAPAVSQHPLLSSSLSTKTLPSCLAVSHHPDRGEREAWRSGRGRWVRRRGCTASGGSGLGERLRKAPSTARLVAGLGKVSTHGCGHQILISGHVGAAVWGWNSTLCRCTGAKSHPAGADGQARAAEPAVLGASWPRGAAGGTRGAGGIALVASLDTPVTSAPALWSLWPGGLH